MSTSTLSAFRTAADNGQKPGETWQQFFARRTEKNSKIKARESVAQRTAREQCVKHAGKYGAPGRKGARVFYWEEADDGSRVRTPMGFNTYLAEWSRYPSRQKRYDRFADEWDICSDFDNTATYTDESDYEDGEPRRPAAPQNAGGSAPSGDPPQPAEEETRPSVVPSGTAGAVSEGKAQERVSDCVLEI